ncbi:MAG: glycerophosphodiester phosphodiesterase [Candidatus Omnitrophica bacterium]|nr:glycerophosphodiester phosphodiesterase [Candidatus Omnitrophota bacterium]
MNWPARPLVIAHRGASADAPESTRAAIRLAVAQRADMIELDVQLTRDGRLVIFHDDTLERTTNGHGRLMDHRFREIARLDAGAWRGRRCAGERVLLVSQALRAAGSCRVNLELKAVPRPAMLLTRLNRVLDWSRARRRVLISSFDPALVRGMRRREPRMATALLCREHWTASLRQARRLGCAAIHPHISLITSARVRQAHAAGLRVHAWTTDSRQEAARLLAQGVDGVVTNRPARLASRRVAR